MDFKNLFSYIIRNKAGVVRLECNRYGKIVRPTSGLMLTDILPCPFFEYNIASAELVMDKMTKKDIMDILERRESVPKENMTKEKLITWCVDNLPYMPKDLPQIISLSCSPCFQGVLQEAYRYLRRKYEWSMFYVKIEADKDMVFYPSEAVFVNSNVVQNLSNTVFLPIAGSILAFVMTLELVQILMDKNNHHDIESAVFFKWIFNVFRIWRCL